MAIIFDMDGDEADTIVPLEEKTGWKTLMAKAYNAISNSEQGEITTKALEIRDTPVIPNSALGSEQPNNFLRRLETFKNSILSQEVSASWLVLCLL